MKTKNQSNAASVISSHDCENVEILFGLNPSQLYFSIGNFFELPLMCSVALMEMLEAIQLGNEKGDDVSILIDFTKTVRILVDLERLQPVYDNFCSDADHPEFVSELHNSLLSIVQPVDAIGFIDFSAHAAGSICDITTKRAYEDTVCALSCIYAIYIAYIKSIYSFKVQQYAVISKN